MRCLHLEFQRSVCFTICLFVSPDLDGHRALKMKYCPVRAGLIPNLDPKTCFCANVAPVILFIDSNKEIPHHFCATHVEGEGVSEKETQML